MADVLQMLREDHKKVQTLFEEFERTEKKEAKKGITDNASMELMTHMELEEELFYPELEKQGGEAEEMIAEAEEEHHVVKLIISELADMRAGDSHYDAKMKVMAENVQHHIEEEESQVFPLAEKLGRERLNMLGNDLMRAKERHEKEMARGTRRRRRAA